MADSPTIGVLSPFIGGVYYGAILAGITRAATLAGSKVVAVQTLDAGAYMTVASAPRTSSSRSRGIG